MFLMSLNCLLFSFPTITFCFLKKNIWLRFPIYLTKEVDGACTKKRKYRRETSFRTVTVQYFFHYQ